MNRIWRKLTAIVFFLALLPSCKKRGETEKSDLGEAGAELSERLSLEREGHRCLSRVAGASRPWPS